MGIRMTGLISNLDTDSIIKELMKAQSTRKVKLENKITTTEWKQEKWKELNTKIYALYTGSINKMKLQGSFSTKKVTSSDESKVSVTASTSAVAGSHNVQVNKLASAQYMTGNKVDNISVNGTITAVNSNTKLIDIDSSLKATASEETKINFATEDKSFSLTVTDKTTVNDFVTAAKAAGINASYDTTQKRFFLSGSNSGYENAFSITTSVTSDELSTKDSLRGMVGYTDLSSANQAGFDNAMDQYKVLSTQLQDVTLTETDKATIQEKLNTFQDTINTHMQNKVTQELKTAYSDSSTTITQELATRYGVRTYDVVVTEATNSYRSSLNGATEDPEDLQAAVDKAVAQEAAKYATAVKDEFVQSAPADNLYSQRLSSVNTSLASLSTKASAVEDAVASGSNKLVQLGLSTVKYSIDNALEKVTYETSDSSVQMTEASNSQIVYNGATITGESNSITANGLTFDLHAVTQGTTNPTISLTVAKDNQGIYDTVKKFVKDYNEVLKEMNSLYYADSAKGYSPLTDEQKETMSEDQIEKWESKIKGSLLRRDDKLSSLLSTMKNSLMASVPYNGKSYALSTFGIGTNLYTEKGILHIDGDVDDSTTSEKPDKLMKALEENPEAVMTTLSTLAGNLYSDLTNKMKTTTLSSALTFYNDKELAKNLTTHKSDLGVLEKRLKKIEDRYYDQFSAMETAMAKLNSQTSSLSALIGG